MTQAADEACCSSCGEVIKAEAEAEAEVCPECGVAQSDGSESDIPQSRKFEVQQVTRKSTGISPSWLSFSRRQRGL